MKCRSRSLTGGMALLLGLSLATVPVSAEEGAESERDRRFLEMVSGKRLEGKFNISGAAGESAAHTDLYMVSKLERGEGNTWIFTATMGYNQSAMDIPVPVEVLWAGETPVITVTDQAIEGLGSGFSARVLIDDGQYAGTWKHGPVGGHMWGRLVAAEAVAAEAEASEAGEEPEADSP